MHLDSHCVHWMVRCSENICIYLGREEKRVLFINTPLYRLYQTAFPLPSQPPDGIPALPLAQLGLVSDNFFGNKVSRVMVDVRV
jgi:hypothetical protein